MEGFEVLVAMVTMLAAVLLFFSFMAYSRERSRQLIAILIITSLLFIKGLILSIWIFVNAPEDMSDVLVVSLLIDFIILLLLFVTGFRGAKEITRKQRSKKKKRKASNENTE